MRFLWIGLLCIVCMAVPALAVPIVDISPDYLYQNTPVTISYSGFDDGTSMSVGFQDMFTPSSSGSFGITGSSFSLSASFDPGSNIIR